MECVVILEQGFAMHSKQAVSKTQKHEVMTNTSDSNK